MEKLPITIHNVIKTHFNHHIGLVVDTSCYHDWICVRICCAIKYGLPLLWVTLHTLTLTTLDMIVVFPIPFIISDVKQKPTSTRTLVNGFAYRMCHKYDFPYLMAELVHMYDVVNEPVPDQNVSYSIQNWSIVWPSSSSDWRQYNLLITQTIVVWS